MPALWAPDAEGARAMTPTVITQAELIAILAAEPNAEIDIDIDATEELRATIVGAPTLTLHGNTRLSVIIKEAPPPLMGTAPALIALDKSHLRVDVWKGRPWINAQDNAGVAIRCHEASAPNATLEGHSRAAVECYDNSAPTLHVDRRSHAAIGCHDHSEPVIRACGHSVVDIHTFDDSRPFVSAFDDSAPEINIHDRGMPSVRTHDNRVPVIHDYRTNKPQE